MIVKNKELVINPKYTYSKSEYARRFSISRVTIDRMIKDGELKTIHVNGAVLIVQTP